jgi:hypothetical protein
MTEEKENTETESNDKPSIDQTVIKSRNKIKVAWKKSLQNRRGWLSDRYFVNHQFKRTCRGRAKRKRRWYG